jgi:hypothetical protein
MHNMSICYTSSPARRGRYRSSGMSYGFLKEASTCVIEAAADVGVEYPLTTVFSIHSRVDSFNSVHRATPWPKSIGVRFKACRPFWFQGSFNNCLHHPVLPGWYAQGSLLSIVFGDIHPSDRFGLVPLQAQALLKQLPSGFWGVVHHPINPCGVFPLVFLCNTAESQEFVGRGSNKQLLEILDSSPCFVHRGAIDTFLQASYILFHGAPVNIRPCGVEVVFRPFDERFQRLTSPKMLTLLDFSPVRTIRQSAPFRAGYLRSCGPIHPATEWHSLFPLSATLCSVPLPYGWDTTFVGGIGLTQLSVKKHMAWLGLSLYPGGRVGCRHSQSSEVIQPTYHFGDGLSASLAISA